MQHHHKILLIATVLLFCGAGFPFLMILKVFPTTFWLSILSYAASVVGFVLGIYGVTTLVLRRKETREWEDWRNGNGY
ncbi:MAG: hypothetical protein ACPG8W_15985 [Candidatus Promineifilaceae bacterium]